ncbi:MAG TPA: hypothetical protein VG944_04795 [Fimbriimonas sp.]|nr:hypothetical protein [Fimbriimonas sp.]
MILHRLGLLALVLASPGDLHVYLSQDGQTKLVFGPSRVDVQPNGDWLLAMRGGVEATLKRQGLSVKSDSATALLHQKGQETTVQKLHAIGSVVIVKAVSQKKTRITGSSANYQAGAREDRVDLRGPVHLVDMDSAGGSLFDATGSSGSVSMSPSAKGKDNPVRSAVLHGPVKLTLKQAGKKGGPPSKMVATGRELTYNHTGLPSVTLTGGVVMKGLSGPLSGTFHADTVILKLNEKGEETGFEIPERKG